MGVKSAAYRIYQSISFNQVKETSLYPVIFFFVAVPALSLARFQLGVVERGSLHDSVN